MNRILATALVLCLVACNRGSGAGGRDGGGPSKNCPGCDIVAAVDSPDMATAPCGDVGQLCCSNGDGLSCNEGLVCVDNATCQLPVPVCQAEGSLCFTDGSLTCCDGLVCTSDGVDSTCQVGQSTPDLGAPDCGTLGLACCDGTTCTDSVCIDGTCKEPPAPCGAVGETCCQSETACSEGLECILNVCQIPTPPVCGDVGQRCCEGGTCGEGLSCSDTNVCLNPDDLCVHPHGRGHAYGWYLHHCHTKVFNENNPVK